MNVREINNINDLAFMRGEWDDLLRRTPQANFFQSFAWLAAYWRHFGEKQRLRVLIVESQGEVRGILPLVVRQERTRVGTLKYLTYPLDHWGSFYGPIGPFPDEVLAEGLDYLKTVGAEADVLELRWLSGEFSECDRTERLLQSVGYSPQRSALDSTAIIDTSGTWEDYLASRTSKWRNNYRRWKRQADKQGEVRYFRFRPEASADGDLGWEYYEECLRIASASWQGSSQTGTTLTHPEVADFLRDVHEVAARSGCLDLNILYFDDRAIAFAYNYVYEGHVYGLRVGFDPTTKCKAAGNLLYALAIEDSFCRDDWRYDLGPRHLDCKRSLLTDVLPIFRLSCYKSWSLRQQLMRLKRQWEARAEESVAVAGLAQV